MIKPLSLIEKTFLLKKTPLFEELDLDLLLTVADIVDAVSFEAGQPIFFSGQEASRMYVIAEGRILIKAENQELLAILSQPDFFGDEALLSDAPRRYTAICQTDSRLLVLTRTHLLTLISECPSIALALLKSYTSAMPFRHSQNKDT